MASIFRIILPIVLLTLAQAALAEGAQKTWAQEQEDPDYKKCVQSSLAIPFKPKDKANISKDLYTNEIHVCLKVANDSRHMDYFRSSAFSIIARAYCSLDDLDKALENFGMAMKLDENSSSLYSSRAQCYRENHEYDQAISNENEVVRITIETYDEENMKRKDSERKVKMLTDSDTYNQLYRPLLFDGLSQAYNFIGNCYAENNNNDMAIAYYGKAIDGIETLFQKQGGTRSAMGIIEDLVTTYKNRAATWKAEGEADRARADTAKAVDWQMRSITERAKSQ
jgi:tetratricopeptide (TPR) repeat protein